MESPESDVFVANCILLAKQTLAPFTFTTSKQEDLDDHLAEISKDLVEVQYEFLVDASGLEAIFEAIFSLPPIQSQQEHQPSPLHTLEVFQPQALMATSQQLDDFLPSALMDAVDYLRELRSPAMVREVTEMAVEKFCADFEMLEDRLVEADEEAEERVNGDGEEGGGRVRLKELFPRSGPEIRVLLS
jgi:hypothetical protein